jgi:hypothetical protein
MRLRGERCVSWSNRSTARQVAHLSPARYLDGLGLLGHEAHFFEGRGDASCVDDWDAEEITTTLDYPGAFERDCLTQFRLDHQWLYRAGDGSLGIPIEAFREACAGAVLLLIRAVPVERWRPEYDPTYRRASIDADPGFTQISLVNGDKRLANAIDRCERLFTRFEHQCRPSAGGGAV